MKKLANRQWLADVACLIKVRQHLQSVNLALHFPLLTLTAKSLVKTELEQEKFDKKSNTNCKDYQKTFVTGLEACKSQNSSVPSWSISHG